MWICSVTMKVPDMTILEVNDTAPIPQMPMEMKQRGSFLLQMFLKSKTIVSNYAKITTYADIY